VYTTTTNTATAAGDGDSDGVADSTNSSPTGTAAATVSAGTGSSSDTDDDTVVLQSESCRVGFRAVRISEGLLRVNGIPLIVNGVNRHEHDERGGKAVRRYTAVQDVLLLKVSLTVQFYSSTLISSVPKNQGWQCYLHIWCTRTVQRLRFKANTLTLLSHLRLATYTLLSRARLVTSGVWMRSAPNILQGVCLYAE
jgi:Glycosyl hydrolases family 2, TIM barrel domain